MEHWLFGDESGNFDFSPKGTKYFLVGTITASDTTATNLRRNLDLLRESLAAEGADHDGVFHAAEDRQAVRDRVFTAIVSARPRCDVTILDKARAYDHLRETDERFYQYAWFYHLRYVLRYAAMPGDTVHIRLADIGTKAKRVAFRSAVDDVLHQLRGPSVTLKLAFWKPGVDSGLQAADYVLWAVARNLERNDPRSYRLIEPLLASEFHLFGRCT
jgi:hypothetical protein